jgi:hypothetical protein
MADPFTLRIYVPSGVADGVRIIDRMNWTGRGIVVPRDRWGEVKARPEIARPGIYVLTGYEADELGNDRLVAYVGQTDNLKNRIDQHAAKGDWWDRAVMFFSANDGLNRAHTTWIEWELIRRAAEAKRCRLENRAEPSEPALIESEKADTRAFVSEMLRIAPVMGLMIFDAPKPVQRAALAAAGLLPEPKDVKDTLVIPAQREGFERVFLGQHVWWAIRVAEKHMPNLKWIAGYQTLPTAAVTHLAEIERFEPYGDAGKWKVVFKAPATALPTPIPFGDAAPGSMQGPRYTTRDLLSRARTVKDLLR